MPKSLQSLEVALLIMNINGTRDVEVEGFKILIMIKVTKQPILVVVYGHTCRYPVRGLRILGRNAHHEATMLSNL
jgi:hypothetical protein